MRSFAERSREPELMDGAEVTEAEFAACLRDLATVNSVVGTRPPTLAWLGRATSALKPGDSFSLLDVGYGEGDMLRAIDRWARARGLVPRLAGVDLNPRSEPAAKTATDPAAGIQFRTGDVFAYAPAEPADYVISSQVTHHMTDDQVAGFLVWMERSARRGWFVNDLHRHPVAFYGFMALSTAARWHPFVRHDGPVSVARAFRRADWERLIAAAGLPRDQVSVAWSLPFRLCVGRIK